MKVTSNQKLLIAGAFALGRTCRGGFNAGVTGLNAIVATLDLKKVKKVGEHPAVIEFGLGFKAGYIVEYLTDFDDYLQRIGNFNDEQLWDDARMIYGRAYPTSSKPDRRTALEHKACRASDVSWHGVKVSAGVTIPKKRAANRKQTTKAPPVDMVVASPAFKNKAAANDYFATAAVALLATVDKNAKKISPQLSSAVSDFFADLKTLGLVKGKGRKA